MWKWLLATLLFSLLVVELVFFAPNPGDRQVEIDTSEETEELKQDVEQVIGGGHLIESQGEKKVWELRSKQARKKKGSTDLSLDVVNVKFFGKQNVSYVADGDNGFVAENQKKLKIDGDVVVKSSNGYVMNTDVVYYDRQNRKIDGPNAVKLKGLPDRSKDAGPLFMEGDSFDANLDTNRIHLKNNVKGRKRISGGRKMKIRSESAEFSGQSNFALFKKNVVIDVNSMRITGPRAKFIYKDKALHSMYIDGGVKIKDIGKWGVAGEAEVFFQEDKYIFRGSPKVVQADDQLIGEVITIYDGGERVRVEKAKTRYKVKDEGVTTQ